MVFICGITAVFLRYLCSFLCVLLLFATEWIFRLVCEFLDHMAVEQRENKPELKIHCDHLLQHGKAD